MIVSGIRRVSAAGRCPTVREGPVSAAGVQHDVKVVAAPDNHLVASPHPITRSSRRGRISRGGSYPTVRVWIVSAPGVRDRRVAGTANIATPDDHFGSGPHRRVIIPGNGRVGRTRNRPTVSDRIVPSTIIQKISLAKASPHDHLAASPHQRMSLSSFRRVGSTGGLPIIRGWIISAAGIQKDLKIENAAPDNHFVARPHRGVETSL